MDYCYIGTYTKAAGQGIALLEYDPRSGRLSAPKTVAEAENPSWLTQAGGYLLATVETDSFAPGGQGGVLVFRVGKGGRLELVHQAASGGALPCHLCYLPGHRLVFASNYGSGTVGAFRLGQDGRLAPLATLCHRGGGPRPEQQGPHAHCALAARDGGTLYVCDLGMDRVVAYDVGAGGPPFVKTGEIALPAGSGPRHGVLSADGAILYILCELSNQLYACKLASGELAGPWPVADVPAGQFAAASAIRLAPGGKGLVASCREVDCLTWFELAPGGMPANRVVEPCGRRWPRDFDFCPEDGEAALVAFEKSDCLQLWRHGGLSRETPMGALGAPVCVCWWKGALPNG